MLFKRLGNASQAEGEQSVMGGMGQDFGPFSVVIAAATNVGVLERRGLFRAFQEGTNKAGLEDRTDGRHGAGVDGDPTLAGRIDTLWSISFDQGQHTQTGAKALLGVRAVGHHISQKAATAGPVFVACANILAGVHPAKRRCADGIWSGTVTWLRRPGVRTWLATL